MIPQVNAGATRRNWEQSRRICKLLRYAYYPHIELDIEYQRDGSAIAWKSVEDNERLPNGSLAPCQVWGMLEAEGVTWGYWTTSCDEPHEDVWGWFIHGDEAELLVETKKPHDLTAAMDALIKVLETKGEKV